MTYEARPCTWKNETLPFDKSQGAHGIRKTHDVALFFDETSPSRAALFYNQPLSLTWSPAYTARTAIVQPATRRALTRLWLAKCVSTTYLDFLLGELSRLAGPPGYLDYFVLTCSMGFNTVEGRLDPRLRRARLHQRRGHALPGASGRRTS